MTRLKTNIIIGLLAAGVGLLAYPQYQAHQQEKVWQARQAVRQAKEAKETAEFHRLICSNLKNHQDEPDFLAKCATYGYTQ